MNQCSATKNSRKGYSRVLLFSMVWVLAVAAGAVAMSNYENKPGRTGPPQARWPVESRIPRSLALPTLVVFAHPHCACTRATIGELELLMTRCLGRAAVFVVFLKPENFSDGWAETDLWESAKAIPGVTVLRDDDGAEAKRFHAAISGYSVLYDTRGELLFAGGITFARGHAGDNAGRSALVALIEGRTAEKATPVFGCPLFGTKTNCKQQPLHAPAH
jgi:hypothetical protein